MIVVNKMFMFRTGFFEPVANNQLLTGYLHRWLVIDLNTLVTG